MDRNKKIVLTIVCVFMIVNIWTTLSLKEQVKNLQNEIGRISSEFRNEIRNTSQDINNLRNDLSSKIEKGESLLSSIETEIEYKNEQLTYKVKVVPKEKRSDEIVFLSLGDEKKEAISTNDSQYSTTFVLTMPQKIIPIVSFESPAGVRQEVLPETDVDELLSLGYDSIWKGQIGSDEKDVEILTLTVYPRDEKSYSLLSGKPDAAIIIKDVSKDTEISRKKMKSTEANAAFGKESKAISFNADLSEYSKKEGSYAVWVELKTEGGIFYREQIASITNEYDEKKNHSFANTGGEGVLYPIW